MSASSRLPCACVLHPNTAEYEEEISVISGAWLGADMCVLQCGIVAAACWMRLTDLGRQHMRTPCMLAVVYL